MAQGLDRDAAPGLPRVVKIGGRKYAFGLVWDAAQSAKTAAREAREQARRSGFGADLWAARVGKSPEPQFGLGRRSDGLEAGAYAAAAGAANAIRGSWLGAFKVASGWWVVAVRDDLILHDGDLWFDTEMAARQRFASDAKAGDWSHTFAPSEDWGDKPETLTVDDIFAAERPPRLVDVNPFNIRAKVFLGMLIFLVVLGGAATILYMRSSGSNLSRVALPPPPQRARAAEIPPWYLEPAPGDFLAACYRALLGADDGVPGWAISTLQCDEPGRSSDARAVIYYRRDGGTVQWFQTWFLQRPHAGAAAVGAQTARVVIDLGAQASARRGAQPIATYGEIEKSLVGFAQGSGTALQLGLPRQPPMPPGQKPSTYIRPAWLPAGFELSTAAPQDWAAVLARIPGLVVEQVEFQPKNSKWILKGDVYVRN